MTAPDTILKLVDQFHAHRTTYKSSNYNETQVRREFVDPFFEALGWDVFNKQSYAHAYKDVIHEDAIKVAGKSQAPDYAFRIGGTRKFFVEAKKPAVNLKDEISPAYQLRRYAWSAKLPLSILTDFEEFSVYDCRIKPSLADKPSVGRIMMLTYNDYPQQWDEIYSIFSKDAVWKGSFDKYAESKVGKHGTAEVDHAFLAEIERWRDLLARNIALRNPALSQHDLNYAVQMTIDRLIFLRICEDRGIEFYGQLQSLLNGGDVYPRLCQHFRKADERYNSGLFHFHAEKGQSETPDGLTLGLTLDDKPLKDILSNLYYPESPYEFSVLPADILGQVYEQFLGKVIRLTTGHRAVVEDKPEVKKAGGVFYTPTYIVEYIVKNTLGRLLEGKHPGDMGVGHGASIRVLDMACGSGSFLIVAYQTLLDWYLNEYFLQGAEKWAKGRNPRLAQSSTGDWRLTTAERKRILLDHIYGVDIDPQAVEVTKLSLLLKVLEGESEETVGQQLSMFHERALPNLGQNIKCGNSLIGSDFYSGQQASFLDDEEQRRINAFDWEREFPHVFASSGGFDVVVGNPPYGAWFTDIEKVYIKEHYKTYQYKFDSFQYFIEKALLLIKSGGCVSFITPELWLTLENSFALRKFISENSGFDLLKVCGENVFTNAVVNTIVFRLFRNAPTDFITIETKDSSWQLPTELWINTSGMKIEYRIKPEINKLIRKVRSKQCHTLDDYGETIQGITPYDKYRGQNENLIKQRSYHHREKIDDTCGKWLAGKDVTRYQLGWSGEWLSYGPWLAAPRDPRLFTGTRLLFREVPGSEKRIQATLAIDTYYHGHSITPFKPSTEIEVNINYLLGIVNSKLISFYGGYVLPNYGKEIFPKMNPQDIKAIPIRTINFTDPADFQRHARMVSLVERMLSLQRELAATQTPGEKTRLQRQVDATDAQIDAMVYELYGLTEEEIKIVEGKG